MVIVPLITNGKHKPRPGSGWNVVAGQALGWVVAVEPCPIPRPRPTKNPPHGRVLFRFPARLGRLPASWPMVCGSPILTGCVCANHTAGDWCRSLTERTAPELNAINRHACGACLSRLSPRSAQLLFPGVLLTRLRHLRLGRRPSGDVVPDSYDIRISQRRTPRNKSLPAFRRVIQSLQYRNSGCSRISEVRIMPEISSMCCCISPTLQFH
jgi:hypothetical protein